MKLWRENRLDQEWELSEDEILARFIKSEHFNYYQKGWTLDRALRAFITALESEGGLNSVFEEDEYNILLDKVDALVYPLVTSRICYCGHPLSEHTLNRLLSGINAGKYVYHCGKCGTCWEQGILRG